MTDQDRIETKDKILSIASELFSRTGFDGTSIREIASQSGVNVASINYHFGSKHNLYWSVVQNKSSWLDKGLERIAAESDNIPDLIVAGYEFLMTDPSAIRTTMKMMLSEGVPEPDGEFREVMLKEVGPPGAEHILRVLKKEVPDQVSPEALQWGVKALFSALIHWAMMLASCKAEMMKQSHPELKGDGVDRILRHQSQAILDYLRNNPDLEI